MIDDYIVALDAGPDSGHGPETESQETAETVDVPAVDRPFLSTPFQDYTVAEGLLLVLVLSVIFVFIVKLLKWGFSWLL